MAFERRLCRRERLTRSALRIVDPRVDEHGGGVLARVAKQNDKNIQEIEIGKFRKNVVMANLGDP